MKEDPMIEKNQNIIPNMDNIDNLSHISTTQENEDRLEDGNKEVSTDALVNVESNKNNVIGVEGDDFGFIEQTYTVRNSEENDGIFLM